MVFFIINHKNNKILIPFFIIGTKIKVRDHYHSHRLSVWLSLIPRLHIPIELEAKQIESGGDLDAAVDPESSAELEALDPTQYFYLRHHLLPDHENMATYDGVVKQLGLRIPSAVHWHRRYVRQNMTSVIEAHQRLLYGGNVLGKSGGTDDGNNGQQQLRTNRQPTTAVINGNERFAGRRADADRSIPLNLDLANGQKEAIDLKAAIAVDTLDETELRFYELSTPNTLNEHFVSGCVRVCD